MLSSSFLYQKKKNPFSAKLSLVALMDIFTILVFFLLLNSGENENIDYARYVNLPDSTTGIAPHQELVILIGEEEIWLEDQALVKIDEVLAKPDDVISALAAALTEFTEKKGELTAFEKEKGLSITIMGDRAVPYRLLKSVMATSRQQDYRNISLAVTQIVSSNALPAGESSIAISNSAKGS